MAAWGSIYEDTLKIALEKLGHEVILYKKECRHYTRDMEYALGLMTLIGTGQVAGVISCNYFPIISMVCKKCGIKYYSWVYDCPHYTLYAAPVLYDVNRIACFDREMAERLRKLGAKDVIHLPLGAGALASNGAFEGDKGYDCDVSFVGNLYTNKYNYFDSLSDAQELLEASSKAVEEQIFDYREDHLASFFDKGRSEEERRFLREKAAEQIDKEGLLPGDEYLLERDDIFISSYLEKKVTVEERRRLLESLAGNGTDLRLYTASDTSSSPLLDKVAMGQVDYKTEMPLVFLRSRINLNISLRSIHSGIPLRAIDIMNAGGFLLSNYQKELEEYFDIGRELVTYDSLEDCREKISYYLAHADEREMIAAAGMKAVRERLSAEREVEILLSI